MRSESRMPSVLFAALLLVFADLAHQSVEGVIHAHSGFGGCLDEWNAVLFGHLDNGTHNRI